MVSLGSGGCSGFVDVEGWDEGFLDLSLRGLLALDFLLVDLSLTTLSFFLLGETGFLGACAIDDSEDTNTEKANTDNEWDWVSLNLFPNSCTNGLIGVRSVGSSGCLVDCTVGGIIGGIVGGGSCLFFQHMVLMLIPFVNLVIRVELGLLDSHVGLIDL